MNITAMMAMAATMGASAWADSVGPTTQRKMTVCFEQGGVGEAADHAKMIASKVFLSIGVRLEWRGGRGFCRAHGDQHIVVSLSTHTPRNLLPGALAYALPFEGVHIQVFYDRMNEADDSVLAYVMVHEIAHILQGDNRHSDTGIMKARWDPYDYLQMKMNLLSFTDLDVSLIHKGLDVRVSQRSGPLVTPVAP
jgi:peptidase M48-like protein